MKTTKIKKSQLNRIVLESVNRILKENNYVADDKFLISLWNLVTVGDIDNKKHIPLTYAGEELGYYSPSTMEIVITNTTGLYDEDENPELTPNMYKFEKLCKRHNIDVLDEDGEDVF